MKKTSFIKAREERNFKDKECYTEIEWGIPFGSENSGTLVSSMRRIFVDFSHISQNKKLEK